MIPPTRQLLSRKKSILPYKKIEIVFSSSDDSDYEEDDQFELSQNDNSSSSTITPILNHNNNNTDMIIARKSFIVENDDQNTQVSIATYDTKRLNNEQHIPSLKLPELHRDNNMEDTEVVFDYLDEFGVSISEYEKDLYDRMIKENCLYELSRPRDIDLSFQLTQMSMPTSTEIQYAPTLCNSFADRDLDCSHELFYVKEISESAFNKFQFGRQFNEPNVDRLHIFAWHNISKQPEIMAQFLLEQVCSLELNDQFTYQYYRCVITYLLEWIHWFSFDFFTNTQCCKIVYRIIDRVFDSYKDFRKDCVLLRCLVKILQTHTKTPGQFQFQPATPNFVTLDDISHERIFYLQVDPRIIVSHFKYNGINDWHKITIQELASVNWTDKRNKKENSPHVIQLTTHANNRIQFIVQTILNYPSKHKTFAISYWIRAMEECEKQRNFQLLFLIDGALSHPGIQNLAKGWKKIDKALLRKFEEMREITDPTRKSTQKYRLEILKNPRNSLPFIGPFLTEMVTIDEGNKTFIQKDNNEQWINIFKQRAYFAEIEMIFKEWGGELGCDIDPYLLQLLAEIDAGLFVVPKSR